MKLEGLNGHGGNIYRAAREYGIGQELILDFSSSINSLGVPPGIKESIASIIDSLVNYPDPECTGLKSGISDYLKVPGESIILGNGASEIIFLLYEVLKPRNVLIPAPSFSEYAKGAEAYDCDIRYFMLREEEGFALDTDKLCREITQDVEALFICNPNNPTSKLIDRQELLELAAFTKRKGIWLLVDEAFIELTEGGNDNSLASEVKVYENLFIIRALTKIFAIPGLRLGYGIGSGQIVEKMWRRKLPWSVNSFACSLGRAFSSEKDYLQRTARWLKEEKAWLYGNVCGINKLKAFEPNSNFMLVKILDKALTASGLKDILAKKGILIRDASNFVFLDESFFRIAVKDRDSNIRLIEALEEVFS